MSFSDFTERRVLEHVFGGIPYTPPSTLYVALFTGAPTDSGGGTEVAGLSYARVAITPSSGMAVSGSSPTQVTNVAAIDFPVASGTWGTVTHAGVYDTATGGNLLDWGPVTTTKTITSGDAFRFPAGQFKITLD